MPLDHNMGLSLTALTRSGYVWDGVLLIGIASAMTLAVNKARLVLDMKFCKRGRL